MIVYTATTKDIVLKSITVTLTDAQIKALPTSPVEIVPAPGANKISVFQGSILRRPPFTAGYQGIEQYDHLVFVYNGSTISLDGGFWNDPAASINTIDNVLNYSVDESQLLQDIIYWDGISNRNSSDYQVATLLSTNGNGVNKGISFRAQTNAGTDFTGGDAANTLAVTVFYSVIEI